MNLAHRATTLGMLFLSMAPAYAAAQRGGGRTGSGVGVIGTPRPASGSMVGFGTLKGTDHDGRLQGGERRNDGWNPDMRFNRGGIRPLFLASPFVETQPAPVATPVPYAVPYYYYPVRVPAPAVAAPEAPPYNPANSRTLTIGAGADGGGGVMRIQRLGGDSLRITWLGSLKPMREAHLFLAGASRNPLRTQAVTRASTTALFRVGSIESDIAYTGLTIVYADGATATTLVPYQNPARTTRPAP